MLGGKVTLGGGCALFCGARPLLRFRYLALGPLHFGAVLMLRLLRRAPAWHRLVLGRALGEGCEAFRHVRECLWCGLAPQCDFAAGWGSAAVRHSPCAHLNWPWCQPRHV